MHGIQQKVWLEIGSDILETLHTDERYPNFPDYITNSNYNFDVPYNAFEHFGQRITTFVQVKQT